MPIFIVQNKLAIIIHSSRPKEVSQSEIKISIIFFWFGLLVRPSIHFYKKCQFSMSICDLRWPTSVQCRAWDGYAGVRYLPCCRLVQGVAGPLCRWTADVAHWLGHCHVPRVLLPLLQGVLLSRLGPRLSHPLRTYVMHSGRANYLS